MKHTKKSKSIHFTNNRKTGSQKAKKTLPTTPQRKARVLEKLVKSPSLKRILENKRVLTTKETKRRLQMGDNLLEAISTQLGDVKPTGGASASQRTAYRVLRSVVCMKGKYRVNNEIRTKLKLKRQHQNQQPDNQWWKSKDRQKRKDRISETVRESMRSFYLSAEISREVPNKRATVKVDSKMVQ